MNFHERLKGLIGHEVLVTTRTGDEEKDVPGGVLEEVGADYLVIKTEDEEKGGFAITGAQWFLSLPMVIHIIHQADCKNVRLMKSVSSPVIKKIINQLHPSDKVCKQSGLKDSFPPGFLPYR